MLRILPALLLAFGLMSACSSSDDTSRASTVPTAAPDRYDLCSLLSAKQFDAIAGTAVPESGQVLSMVPERSCVRQDVLSPTEWTVRASYDVMGASRWASSVYADASTAPDAEQALPLLEDALKRSGVTEDGLADLDDSKACEVWRNFADVRGVPVESSIAVRAEPGDTDLTGLGAAETCQEGIYVNLVVQAPDAAADDSIKRITAGVATLLGQGDRVPAKG